MAQRRRRWQRRRARARRGAAALHCASQGLCRMRLRACRLPGARTRCSCPAASPQWRWRVARAADWWRASPRSVPVCVCLLVCACTCVCGFVCVCARIKKCRCKQVWVPLVWMSAGQCLQRYVAHTRMRAQKTHTHSNLQARGTCVHETWARPRTCEAQPLMARPALQLCRSLHPCSVCTAALSAACAFGSFGPLSTGAGLRPAALLSCAPQELVAHPQASTPLSQQQQQQLLPPAAQPQPSRQPRSRPRRHQQQQGQQGTPPQHTCAPPPRHHILVLATSADADVSAGCGPHATAQPQQARPHPTLSLLTSLEVRVCVYVCVCVQMGAYACVCARASPEHMLCCAAAPCCSWGVPAGVRTTAARPVSAPGLCLPSVATLVASHS